MLVPGIDCRHDLGAIVGGDQWRRESGKRGKPDRRLARRQRDAACGRNSHAQPREAAGTGGDGDTIELGEFDAGTAHHAGDERH